MSKFYYNPTTRTCSAKQTVRCTLTTDPHYASEKKWFWHAIKAGDVYKYPYKHIAPTVVNTIDELCELIRQSDFSGFKRFIDAEGNLYDIHQEASFEFAPLEYDGQHSAGINWATKYFFTEEAALAFGERLNAGRKPEDGYFRWDTPEYHEDLDTWSVHYHCYAD